jgi:hypothetical protein
VSMMIFNVALLVSAVLPIIKAQNETSQATKPFLYSDFCVSPYWLCDTTKGLIHVGVVYGSFSHAAEIPSAISQRDRI